MTIDELARRAGETTRNVRAYQSRGLLPHPLVVGRVGHYDEGHLRRLGAVQRLRDRGFSLTAVAVLIDAHDRGISLSDVIEPAPRPGDVVEMFDAAGVPPALRLALVPDPLRRLAG